MGSTSDNDLLAPTEALRSAAAATPMHRRFVSFLEYVADGIRLTDLGNLRLADGKALVEMLDTDDEFDRQIGDMVFKTRSTTELEGLELVFRTALKARFVRRYRGRLVKAGKAELLDDPLEGLFAAWLALVDLGLSNRQLDEPWGEPDYFAELVLFLVTDVAAGRTVTMDWILESMWRHWISRVDTRQWSERDLDRSRRFIEFDIRLFVRRLGDFGVVTVTGVTQDPDSARFPREVGGEVRLTDLGAWLQRRQVSENGVSPSGSE